MRKVIAIVALGAFLVAASPLTAHAHGAALALAAFAAFTSLVTFPIVAAAAYAPYYSPYYAYPAPAVVSAPPAYYAAAPPPSPLIQREVVYPHGRHVLYGDGVRTAYQWVWVPTPPGSPSAVPLPPVGPPPPPPPAR